MTTDFLWGEPRRPSRGPKPSLSVDGIVDVAIDHADAGGLAAVSMSRVATALGVTKMSLYRYLPGKTELVALMVERAIGEPPAIDPSDWRAGLREWADRLLRGYVDHPWTLEATVGPRPIGPNELLWMERALEVLSATGLTGGERLDAVALLVGHVRMIAQQAVPAKGSAESPMLETIAVVLAAHRDRFPALVASVESTAPAERDQAFAFGLERILDGLEHLDRR